MGCAGFFLAIARARGLILRPMANAANCVLYVVEMFDVYQRKSLAHRAGRTAFVRGLVRDVR